MKSFRSRLLLVAGALSLSALAAHADLPRWLQHLPVVERIQNALFRQAAMPSGATLVRRPPQETRAALGQLIAAAPAEMQLYALRAREAEEALDFTAAEQDWKRFAELAPDKAAGQLELADFYHRRFRPPDEVRALEFAAAQPAPSPFERFRPLGEQRSWRTFVRAAALVDAQALPVETGVALHRAWIARYPSEPAAVDGLFDYLLAHKRYTAATELIASYRKTFPRDAIWPVKARSRIEESRGSTEQALAIYGRAFQPLWPPELVKDYFGLLDRTHNLRRFLDRARAAIAANPNDLSAAARVFYYYQQQGNLPAAHGALAEYRLRKQARKNAWTPEELWTLARLYEATQQYQEAVRNYYELYTAANGAGADGERALAGIIGVLLTAPEQPIRLGAGDLSFYKDVATMDPYPGFLNGILSLLLNSTSPGGQYADEDRAAGAYFHRVRAAELLTKFDSLFANSRRRPVLQSQLIQAYATYGDSDGVIRASRKFLAAFAKAEERTRVSILMAEAYARKNDTKSEFATYDELLKELAAKADGVPLGETLAASQPAEMSERAEGEGEGGGEGEGVEQAAPVASSSPAAGVRSREYSRVLERYISRLVSLKRPLEALRVLRGELDRNPNDPGLYERLASFMEQNRMDAQVAAVYRRAIQQLASASWYDKLGRWYIRQKQAAEFSQLAREVIGVFSGTDLERYFQSVVEGQPFSGAMYVQLNLYAHERFPNNMTFVHNLVNAYRTTGTEDWNAHWRLLSGYWYCDEALRRDYFFYLAKSGKLAAELEQVRTAVNGNPAAQRFVAEAEAWRSHFEDAAEPLEALAAERPGDAPLAHRAASLTRSLAAFDPRFTEKAAGFEEKLHQFDPRSHEVLTQLGEVYADREMFDRARPHWNKLAEIEPGKSAGYLEAATVFWDYFLYDDALRLLELGRKNLGQPALYAYEAGAIYENKRDYSRAVLEYTTAATEGSSARQRLIQLARRPAQRPVIEKLTTQATAGPNPDAAAVSLRIAILDAQNRRDDLVRFLTETAGRAGSLELLDQIRETAGRLGLDDVPGRILERQVAIATDPVERMRLELSLMRFYEGRRQTDRARQTIEALHTQNPTILGVVRATVDFYWRNKMQTAAVDTLLRAAASANATLKPQLTLEAAAKSTEAADFARARQLLEELLKAEPFRPEYLTAMADVYARQKDERGLRDFFVAKIKEIPDQAQKIVLRRSLIPVLTNQKDYTGGVDQYIEILRAYPDDEGATREAASYSAAHGMRDRLLAYFKKAVADSPRDYRWPMAMARLQTFFEDLPAAIASYSQATAIRPDRVDLHIARASLEERLMRFDDALRSYTKIYDLAYRDPQWMRKVAELHARRGETEAAVKALRVALIEGRPERPQPFFEAAQILDSWNMLDPARKLAERGVELAGNDLLPEYRSGAQTYARIMTRLRAHKEALATFEKLPAEEDALQGAAEAIGRAAKIYFTPEEKSEFEAFLEKEKPKTRGVLASSAGLKELEARCLFEQMMAEPGSSRAPEARFFRVQQGRMRHEDLARSLIAYWTAHRGNPKASASNALLQAAQAYRSAGDEAGELATLSLADRNANLRSTELLGRYLDLLLKRDPEKLIAIAGERSDVDDAAKRAANLAVASGNPGLAFRAVEAHGKRLDPVWTRAYTGLTGLYYANTAPSVQPDFLAALGSSTISDQLGKTVARAQRLAGANWYYYGTAYGEYMAVKKLGDPEDYLPALLEGAAARAEAYVSLADLYSERHDYTRAIADYEHSLELKPGRGEVESRIAEILWEQGKREAAVARWRTAFQAYSKTLESGRPAATFWPDLERTLRSLGKRQLLPQVREDASRVLRNYIQWNGAFRAEELLHAAYDAADEPAAGVAWVSDLIQAADQPAAVCDSVIGASWLPVAQREPLYRQAIAAAEASVARFALEPQRKTDLQSWRQRWITYLLDAKQPERARAELDALPPEIRGELTELASFEIRIAAQGGTLDALIARYRREPERAPSAQTLGDSAATLTKTGNEAAARRLLEFMYTREIDQRNLTAANFLGLAEVRLAEKDLAGAIGLLRRMTLVADEPFQDLEPAADLLIKMGYKAEARPFLEERVKAAPWEFSARTKLGDPSVVSSPLAPYELRVQAAALKPSSKTGSGELDLIAAGSVAPAAAERPFYYHARVRSAAQANEPAVRLRLLTGALAIDPDAQAPRIGAFRAALAAGNPQKAIAAVESALENLAYVWSQNREETEMTYYAQEFFAHSGYSDSDRASIATGLGASFAKTGQWSRSTTMYRLSLAIQPSAEARSGLEGVQTELRRREEDARRRPAIAAGLEQENLVRVRQEGGDAQ